MRVGDKSEACSGTLVQRRVSVKAEASNVPSQGRQFSCHSEDRGGLPSSIRSEQSDDLTFADFEVDVAHDADFSIARDQVLEFHQRFHAGFLTDASSDTDAGST